MKRITELHREKANVAYALYEIVSRQGDTYRGWQITLLFYSALHWVQAYIVEKSIPSPKSHTSRDELISKTPTLRDNIGSDYNALKDLSMTARYEVLATNDRNVEDALIAFRVVKEYIEGAM